MNSILPLIIVTGLSGSGKTTALKVLEDLGFFSVDGLPLPMCLKLIQIFEDQGPRKYRGIALGVDTRQIEYLSEWEEIKNELIKKGIEPTIIFLEADEDVIIKRYAATRRPHPLESQQLALKQAIELEKRLLEKLKNDATLVIDTTNFSIHDLRRNIQSHFDVLNGKAGGIRIQLISFGYKYGIPREADIVIDLRFLPNPYFDENLRPYSGKEKQIQDYILKSPTGQIFLEKLMDFLNFILPLYSEEGRYRLTIAFGCTGGYHRSVAVTERVYRKLKEKNYTVQLEHRHLSLFS